jgi:hypothetical protein
LTFFIYIIIFIYIGSKDDDDESGDDDILPVKGTSVTANLMPLPKDYENYPHNGGRNSVSQPICISYLNLGILEFNQVSLLFRLASDFS